ncbi:MAG: N-acetylmuramoyl-L-alanine amidase [Spirochaetales bacterium]|nr:N-acetylmuramoyl-L-alanine amidase [Spirochaetales bacterium]
MNRKIIPFILLFIIMGTSLYAEDGYVSIVKLSKECGFDLRYDVWKGIYEMRRGNTVVRFSENTSWYLYNMDEIYFDMKSIKKADGSFYIDEKTAADLKSRFEKAKPILSGVKYIILDPGHGGKDPGAIGYFTQNGVKKTLKEKDVVLQTAIQTAALLKVKYPDKEIILTRDTDRYLKLDERTQIANSNSAKLEGNESMVFISIHANASFNTKAKGFEVWYLPQEYRRDLLGSKNLDSVDSDVIPILNTMLEEEYTIESVNLANILLKSLDSAVGELTVDRGSKEESWFVVRNAHMPSVLIEVGFVTAPDEAVLLSSTSYLKKLSNGIYNGIVEFVNEYETARGYSR